MERINFINAERIQWCCYDAGISVDGLALESGVSLDSLHHLMDGKAGLTFNQLATIADFFGRGVLFFLEENAVQEDKAHSVEFRTLANQKPNLSLKLKKLIERVEFQRDRYLSLIEDLSYDATDIFQHPILDSDINTVAQQVREWLGVKEKNDFDSYRKAIEKKGILVFQSNGYHGKWQIPKESPIIGFSLYHASCPVIVVRKKTQPARQVFTLMHELGHLLLHKTSSIDDDNDLNAHQGREFEANHFAGLVLVPGHFLNQIDLVSKPSAVSEFTTWLAPYKKTWGVSTEVILRRLSDQNLISANDYAAYRNWLKTQEIINKDGGSRKYRHREPQHIFGDKYVRTVFDAKNAQQLSLAKTSSYLDNLKVKDLKQLEQYIAGY